MFNYRINLIVCNVNLFANNRFRTALVKDVIHSTLQEELSGKNYDPQEVTLWTKGITDTIKLRLKG